MIYKFRNFIFSKILYFKFYVYILVLLILSGHKWGVLYNNLTILMTIYRLAMQLHKKTINEGRLGQGGPGIRMLDRGSVS